MLRGGVALVASPGLLSAGPAIHVNRRPKLRVLGTHVTLQPAIRERAQRVLDIDIEFLPGGSAEVLQKASTFPESFDVYEQWSNSIEILWEAGAIQPIQHERIALWNEVNDLCKTGRLEAGATVGKGAAPHRMLYAQANGTLSGAPSQELSFLPYVHNVDSFGYDAASVERGTPYGSESWGWLLDPRWRGHVGIVNEPTIGLFDLALAAEARGLVTFADIGQMTRKEIDMLFEVLIDHKRRGQFGAFWNSVPHSVDLMASGRICVSSMFSPAVSALNGQGHDVVYAAPREGYRAWHGVMCLSSRTSGHAMDAAYRYMNWWLSGWPGAFVARQGYYISNPERARAFLSEAEWAYWYSGLEATSPLTGPDGSVSVRAGEVRRGGSYRERFGHVSVWNTVMREYEYSMRGWYSLLTA
ncbi:hypothetical protein Poly30_00560 [Planctomycetes bacterium Poly30]|uniref:Signal peptide prediction n=1 Tax=Saltatorellus ferox TaxID=2528018 RepID=A0A518EKE7_9BACT|nr:hypothetical protein Poly30_00560 [Planctomycetes bacterium Poly30]